MIGSDCLRRAPRIGAFVALTLLASCGGSDSSPAQPSDLPEIQISGVEDGVTYAQPVTITFSASPAGTSLSAELNGEPFRSGDQVSRPGAYTLRVEAFRAGRTAAVEVGFSLQVAGDRIFIVRLFDLGPEGLGGGGDAILLSDSSSLGIRHAMIDAGPQGELEGMLDEAYVADRLLELGVDTLEFLQLTHAHMDHFGGMVPILDRIHVEHFVYNGQVRTGGFAGQSYGTLLARAQQRADTVLTVTGNWEHLLGGEGGPRTVHLPPLPSYIGLNTGDGRLLNEGSLGTYVEGGGVRLFFTGDGEDEANLRWRNQFSAFTADLDVLKVGHHGANNAVFDNRTGLGSFASAWLDHTRPRLMLVSANGRSHPRMRATSRLLAVPGAEMYCTSVHGRIEVRIAQGLWQVTPERNPHMDCVPGTEAST